MGDSGHADSAHAEESAKWEHHWAAPELVIVISAVVVTSTAADVAETNSLLALFAVRVNRRLFINMRRRRRRAILGH